MSQFDKRRIHAAISKAIRAEDLGDAASASDIAFHMTDWLAELEQWISVCRDPDGVTSRQVTQALSDLLSHAPEHVAAASRLLLGTSVRDIFHVGAVDSNAGE